MVFIYIFWSLPLPLPHPKKGEKEKEKQHSYQWALHEVVSQLNDAITTLPIFSLSVGRQLVTFVEILGARYIFTRHGDQNGRSLESW